LLASDPHLPLSIPSIWYEIHLAGGGLNVAGASIPGIPLVLIGRNERIAWGITASFADVQDHYVVTRNPENPRQYAFGEEWIDFDVYTETIPVANGAPVPLETLRTRYGVVVSDGPQEDRVLALRWDSLWSGDNAYASLLLNQATNWPEFTEALGWLGAVPLSFVYADVDGNIGFFPSGEIPVRSGFDGTVPVDGQSDAYEWLGVVPHEMKPFFFNPEEGYIVSANHKMIADDAEYPLGRDQLSPERANRILSLLTTAGRLRAADFSHMQTDRHDGSIEPILRYLVSIGEEPEEAAQALDLLRHWNGRMEGGPAPAIYQTFYVRLLENTFKDDLGDELFAEFLEFLELGYPGGIYSIIEDPSSTWWDDSRTPAVEDRTAVFRKSLTEAISHLSDIQGSDPQGWDWGTLHGVVFEHSLGGERPLNWLFNRGPAPFGGSAFTLANAVVSLTEPFRVTAGTSFRFVADLSDLNAGSATLPTQNEDWLTGRAHPLFFDRSRIEAILEGKLTLTP
jgi:penicillin amidase